MYKFIEKQKITKIKNLEKDFKKLTKFFIKKKFYSWWFFEVSRLDFRPWGGLNSENFYDIKKKTKQFSIQLLKDFFILVFIIRGVFYKKQNIFYKNIFIQKKLF